MPAVQLTPSPREKVWGRNGIGEIWFLSDRELPLLIKFISTSERLSIQVHPDDDEAENRGAGKTEMWHILDAEPGATIAMGFRRPITREQLRESVRTGEIEALVNWVPVKAGETYFIPAHTVHAIGGGIELCEIQQNSDVTYRLWDYGRPREIHVERAVPLSDLMVHPGPCKPAPVGPDCHELVRCKHFVTQAVSMTAGESHVPPPERSQLWICLEGQGTIGGEAFSRREVWLLPDEGAQPEIRADERSQFLRTYSPG
jgi:mannose-6-phosphate isomerase